MFANRNWVSDAVLRFSDENLFPESAGLFRVEGEDRLSDVVLKLPKEFLFPEMNISVMREGVRKVSVR